MNKKENIFEISVLGILSRLSIENLKLLIEEICENAFTSFKYDITTFKYEFSEMNINNLVELHQNISDTYEKK